MKHYLQFRKERPEAIARQVHRYTPAMLSEGERRIRIVAEAVSWLGTPFHQNANLKNVGVDCGRFLIEVYSNCGFNVPIPEKVPILPRDWHHHGNEEIYLNILERFTTEVNRAIGDFGPKPMAGDIAMFKVGRVFGHSGIVTMWPSVIHVHWQFGVEHTNTDQPPLAGREVKFFNPLHVAIQP